MFLAVEEACSVWIHSGSLAWNVERPEALGTGVVAFFRTVSADSKGAHVPNCEEQSVHGGSSIKPDNKKNLMDDANVDEEPSTLAFIRGDSPRDRMQIEITSACGEATNDVDEDDEKWREPWSREELEQLAITMQDFEVHFSELGPALSVVARFAQEPLLGGVFLM
jgi:hypothetical protein